MILFLLLCNVYVPVYSCRVLKVKFKHDRILILTHKNGVNIHNTYTHSLLAVAVECGLKPRWFVLILRIWSTNYMTIINELNVNALCMTLCVCDTPLCLYMYKLYTLQIHCGGMILNGVLQFGIRFGTIKLDFWRSRWGYAERWRKQGDSSTIGVRSL